MYGSHWGDGQWLLSERKSQEVGRFPPPWELPLVISIWSSRKTSLWDYHYYLIFIYLLIFTATSHTYFLVIKYRLYWVMHDTQMKEERTQLLVPKSHNEMVFHVPYHNPMTGHLARITLNHLMTIFYWLGIHGDVCRWCMQVMYTMLAMSIGELVSCPLAIPQAPFQPLPLITF